MWTVTGAAAEGDPGGSDSRTGNKHRNKYRNRKKPGYDLSYPGSLCVCLMGFEPTTFRVGV